MKITTVIGTRPQFIKASVISNEFHKTLKTKKPIFETIIHTGQHYDQNMSDNFFSELNIPNPKFNLGIGGGSHGQNTGRMIERLEQILIKETPNFLLLYGDTDSTLAGAIAGSKLKIPIIHIEAGLRSFDKTQPEEINRIITDHISSICFAPSITAVNNLIKEGINRKNIFLSGDVMIDSMRIFSNLKNYNCKIFKKLNLIKNEYVLATIHRKENVNNLKKLTAILKSLIEIDLPVILPLHPGTRKKIYENNLNKFLNELIIIDPVGYIDLAIFQKNARVIITDSGGIQKEAYCNKVPCITLRDKTEWVELINSGWNVLVDASNSLNILNAYNQQKNFQINNDHPDFYGDGFSSQKIIKFLQEIIDK